VCVEASLWKAGPLDRTAEERGDRSMNLGNDFADYTVYDIYYEKIGKVDDIFVDENDQARYISVKMGFLNTRTTLIPVELARVNGRRWLVEVAVSKDAVEEGPTFSNDWDITPEFEQRVLNYYGVENYAVETAQAHIEREAFEAPYLDSISNERVELRSGERAGAAHQHVGEEHSDISRGVIHERSSDDLNDENELRVQRVEEELRTGTRERHAGSVRVRKRVRTDREEVRVPKKRQEVSVERVPVEGDMGAFEPEVANDGAEIRVPVIEEEIVVERRPVVKEVLLLRKEVVEDEEVVEENVRKEEINIDDWTERGASVRNDMTVEGETERHLARETRNMARAKEQPARTDGEPPYKKGAPEKARKDLPVRSYNDLTVAEAKKKLDGLPQGELKRIRSYEKNHQNRKTLIEWLNRKITATS
jgi:uncharacterized protein (TIGR02271 family)